MSSILQPRRGWASDAWQWLPIAIGLAALYLPIFYELNHTLWNEEENAHGPIILLVVIYVLWHKRGVLLDTTTRPVTLPGAILLGGGLITCVLGQTQFITLLEVGSLVPVSAGLLLLTGGWNRLRQLWFPVFFLIFMVPLPFVITDALTVPLKYYVSIVTENLLYYFGYPIARDGVILNIGQYQLQVADACSGMNSMFSLTALGCLYLYLMGYKSRWRNGLLLATIVPIAFLANIARVIFLILITYYFGGEAGQGFLHGFAGMVLFVIALLMLFVMDGLFGLIFRHAERRP